MVQIPAAGYLMLIISISRNLLSLSRISIVSTVSSFQPNVVEFRASSIAHGRRTRITNNMSSNNEEPNQLLASPPPTLRRSQRRMQIELRIQMQMNTNSNEENSSNAGIVAETPLTNNKRWASSVLSITDAEAGILPSPPLSSPLPLITPSPRKRKKKTSTQSRQSKFSTTSTTPSKTTMRKVKQEVSTSPRRRLTLPDATGSMDNQQDVGTGIGMENPELVLTTDMIAAINPTQDFIDLMVPPDELRPSNTVTTGQAFHWKVIVQQPVTPSVQKMATVKHEQGSDTPGAKPVVATTLPSAWGTHDATEWVAPLCLPVLLTSSSTVSSAYKTYAPVVVVIRETPTTTLYRPLTPFGNEEEEEEALVVLHRAMRDYFQLDTSPTLSELYHEWSNACPRLASIAPCLPGVRIINQDPWECLLSFICSSNNNIPRITKMLASIRQHYGQPLLKIPSAGGGTDEDYYQFYSFPTLQELATQATEQDLRSKCRMGYRAKYIMDTVEILLQQQEQQNDNDNDDDDDDTGCGNGDSGSSGGSISRYEYGERYLRDILSNMEDPVEVQTKLCELKGVGRKVADCVALFSLHQRDAIPIDTHVWNIAKRDYDPRGILGTLKSLTPKNYKLVADIFRTKFHTYPGWAHSLLFVAELPSYRSVLPHHIIEEMDKFRHDEKLEKQRMKELKKNK